VIRVVTNNSLSPFVIFRTDRSAYDNEKQSSEEKKEMDKNKIQEATDHVLRPRWVSCHPSWGPKSVASHSRIRQYSEGKMAWK
jgi:hypothetical protein